MSNVPVKFVYFDVNTKTEIPQEQLDSYLEDNPTAALIECIRRSDAVLNDQEPIVQRIVPEDENTAIEKIVSEGGSSGSSSLCLSFSSYSLRKNSYLMPGYTWSIEVGHTLPFDAKLIAISAIWSDLRGRYQTLEIVNEDNVIYESPTFNKTRKPESFSDNSLDVLIPSGSIIKVRCGNMNGRIRNIVCNLILEKV